MTTVLDVARIAGLSAATVSRVLSGQGPVSADARKRVLSVVEQLDYRPNPLAQGLRRGYSTTVALLVGDIEQSHFSSTTKQLQVALNSIGLDLLLYDLGHSSTRLCELLDRAIGMQLRAVIIASSDKIPIQRISPLIKALEARGVSIISLGQRLNCYGVASVVHDERAATRRSVEFLLQQRRTRIAYVGRIKGSIIGSQRVAGYKDALRAAGCKINQDLIWDVSFRYSAGRGAVLKAISNRIEIDGLQAGSDELALGAISALKDRGIQVPEDVSVVGFGDVVWSAYLRPALTTVSSSPDLEAQSVLRIFSCLERTEGPPVLSVIERRLIRRNSA